MLQEVKIATVGNHEAHVLSDKKCLRGIFISPEHKGVLMMRYTLSQSDSLTAVLFPVHFYLHPFVG